MRRIWVMAVLAAMAGPAAGQDLARGEALYRHHCAVCHGHDATGQGPRAPVLIVQPTDLTRLAAGAGGAFPAERAARRIDGRDTLVAHGSPMPVWGGFLTGRQASLDLPGGRSLTAPRPVIDVLAYLASIQRLP